MIAFDKIFGLDRALAIVVLVIIAIFLLLVIFLYLSSVFVDKKYNKIIERLGKYKKTVGPGWHFMMPLLDSVVESIDMTDRVNHCLKPISIIDVNNKVYSIDYSIKYHVIDAAKFYYATELFNEMLFSDSATKIINHYKSNKVESSKDIIDVNSKGLLDIIKPIGDELGIDIEEIIITSISK